MRTREVSEWSYQSELEVFLYNIIFTLTLARYRGMEKPSLEDHFVYPNFLELS